MHQSKTKQKGKIEINTKTRKFLKSIIRNEKGTVLFLFLVNPFFLL
jgi:hypothetical protein